MLESCWQFVEGVAEGKVIYEGISLTGTEQVDGLMRYYGQRDPPLAQFWPPWQRINCYSPCSIRAPGWLFQVDSASVDYYSGEHG